jgi:hypothetical protein
MTTTVIRICVCALLASAALLASQALDSSAAFGAVSYVPGGTFGAEGSGNGEFNEPLGIAVNDSEALTALTKGDIYVIDKGNHRVEWFSEGRLFEGQFNGSGLLPGEKTGCGATAPQPLAEPEWVAIDNSGKPAIEDPSVEDVYVTTSETSGGEVRHVVDKFSATGCYEGQLSGTCEVGGEPLPCAGSKEVPFGDLLGVTVDHLGNVWVHDDREAGNFAEFSDDGTFLRSETNERPPDPGGLASDSEGAVYAVGGGSRLGFKFEFGTSAETVAEVSSEVNALAVAPESNNLLLDLGTSIELYTPPIVGELTKPQQSFGQGIISGSEGIAAGARGTAYATQRSADTVAIFNFVLVAEVSPGPSTEISTTEEKLSGSVNPEGLPLTECRFEVGETTAYGQNVPCEQSLEAIGSGTTPVPVTAKVGGLEPGHEYHFRLVAINQNGPAVSADTIFVPFPAITQESASAVTATEASVAARIDAGGAETTVVVEYGPTTQYGFTTSDVDLGQPTGSVAVATSLKDLTPDTTYHYRFVASSVFGVSRGTDDHFTTSVSEAGLQQLPDERAYELVSDVGEPGDVYVPSGPNTFLRPPQDLHTELPFRAAANGDSVVYAGEGTEKGGTGRAENGYGDELVATRDPGQYQWAVTDATPTNNVPHGSEGAYFQGFSGTLTIGVAAAFGQEIGTEGSNGPLGCEALYARTGAAGGENIYRALFAETQTPSSCGRASRIPSRSQQVLQFAGGNAGVEATPEYDDLLFQTPAPITPGDVESPAGEGNNLYESAGSQVLPISVLPDNTRSADAVFGSPAGARDGHPDFSNVISADGSRVFWTDLQSHALYVREDPTSAQATTLQLDEAQSDAIGPSGDGLFWTATPGGNRVYFTDCNRLTKDSTAISTEGCEKVLEEQGGSQPHRELKGNDLYEYNFSAPLGARLTDLTVDHSGGDPLGADVQGVLGASDDGAYVYFVAGGALASGATPRKCMEPFEEEAEKVNNGEEISTQEKEQLESEESEERFGHLPVGRGCNLYVAHAGFPLKLVAVLAAKDDHYESVTVTDPVRLGDWQPDLGARTAEVTGSGQDLVFESTQQLTGYDNASLTAESVESDGGERGTEIFVYNAPSGDLTCASCDPRDDPPDSEIIKNGSVEKSADLGGGTYLPTSLTPTSMRRWISSSGDRVFFDTSQPLAAKDTNGEQDVYEWEREGVGSCVRATSHWGGCVYLLSGTNSHDSSFFVDADASGDNVFIVHRGSLGAIATDAEKANIYDARIGGGLAKVTAGCAGTTCQNASAHSGDLESLAPLTAVTSGSEILKAPQASHRPSASQVRATKLAKALHGCRKKHNKRKRALCERKARHRYRTPAGKRAALRSDTHARLGGAGAKR